MTTHTHRRIFTALAAMALAMVVTTPSLAVTTVTVVGQDVTFVNSGTFPDTGTYTFTAEFTQAALLDDWNVFPAEATRWEMSVTEGTDPGFTSLTWDITDVIFPGDIALVFSGLASNPTFQNFFESTTNKFFWRKPQLFPPTIALTPIGTTLDTRGGPPSIHRETPHSEAFGPLAVHTVDPPPAGVPEPLTSGLAALGVTSLLMSLRRRLAA